MKKGKKKKYNFILYSILMLVLFVFVMLIIGDLGSTIIGSYLMNIFNFSKYGSLFYFELIMTLIIIIVLLLSGNSYIFTEKKEGFFKSVLRCWPEIILIIPTLIFNIFTIINGEFNALNLISLVLFTTTIGLFEELLCRGWLQNEYIERFGDSKKGVILSIVFSSLVFGIMHFANLLAGQEVFNTILQVLSASAGGFLYGAVYYRTKNIWAIVAMHAFWNFCIFLPEYNQLMDCEFVGDMSMQLIFMNYFDTILQVVFFVLAGILVLRKPLHDLENESSRIKSEYDKNSKTNKLLLGIVLITYLVLMAFGLIEVDSGDYKEVCYAFNKLEIKEYERVTSSYDTYSIDFSFANEANDQFVLEEFKMTFYLTDDNELVIRNDITSEEYKADIDNVYKLVVLNNDNNYGILILAGEDVYYTDYMNNNTVTNNEGFLERLVESFEKKYFPSILNAGYIKIEGYNYPVLQSETLDNYIIDRNGKETLLKYK